MAHLTNREEKSEQMLDCRHELENMEAELKRIQQEVWRRERWWHTETSWLLCRLNRLLPAILCSRTAPTTKAYMDLSEKDISIYIQLLRPVFGALLVKAAFIVFLILSVLANSCLFMHPADMSIHLKSCLCPPDDCKYHIPSHLSSNFIITNSLVKYLVLKLPNR